MYKVYTKHHLHSNLPKLYSILHWMTGNIKLCTACDYFNSFAPVKGNSFIIRLWHVFMISIRRILTDNASRQLKCLFNNLFQQTPRKTSNPTLLALCQGFHRWMLDSPHKGPVIWEMFLCHYIAAGLRLRSPPARRSEGIATGFHTTF